ncbi:MAG: GntR family transcriptional regulator [Methylobacteriaceae bacterium]|nr:GntR family transcriptional regulator [Methylobacteriaceae bacterium]
MAQTLTRSGAATIRLREMLLTGEFAPGSRLTEVVLAGRLGVSRTPVRDALSALAQEGLLAYEPNRGYEVRSCTLEDVLGAYQVRQTLEALACRLAAERGLTVVHRARMMDANERIAALLEGGSWREGGARGWRDLNAAFHDTIIAATGNKALARAIADTQRLPVLVEGGGSRWFTHGELVLAFDDAAIRQSQEDHEAIFAALLAQDGERAAAVMTRHIERAKGVLAATWRQSATAETGARQRPS